MLRSLSDEVGVRWNTLCFIYNDGISKTARFTVLDKNDDYVTLLCEYIRVRLTAGIITQLGIKLGDFESGDKLEFRISGTFTGRVFKDQCPLQKCFH